MTDTAEVIVIGGGHNGLVCAAYLAKVGKQVLVLEAGEEVGGAALTRELVDGYRVSTCAHLLNLLQGDVTKDLNLSKHGLQLAASSIDTIALAEDGNHLHISARRLKGGGVGSDDQKAYRQFHKRMRRFARVLQPLMARRPPRLKDMDWTDKKSLARFAWDIRRLGRDEMRDFLRVIAINIYDVLQESFDNDLLKGALGFDAVIGTHLGPRSPNTVLTYLYRLCGQSAGRQGAIGIPKGGMGSVSAALAAAAEEHGATIRTNARVTRVIIKAGVVTGVELEDGEQLRAARVVSNADPKTTFLDLVGATRLEAGFARRIDNLRMRGNAAKLNLALDGPPTFNQLDRSALGNRLLIAPDLGYVERAFDHAKYGEHSVAPVIEISIPSMHDSNLAPRGKHVMSAIVQYAPYHLKTGWDAAHGDFEQLVIDTIQRYAPDLSDRIVARQLLTPLDIEREFRIGGGHWHHGELVLDQFLMTRPVPGAAQYTTPIDGLFLCGAGAHPGGGVMGAAGRNAANELIAREATT